MTEKNRFFSTDIRDCVRRVQAIAGRFLRSETAPNQRLTLLNAVEEAVNDLSAIKGALRSELTPYISSQEGVSLEEPSLAHAYAVGAIQAERIVVSPKVLSGKPCVKGHRIPVALVLRYLAVDDDPIADLHISQEDVKDCLEFAATVCDLKVQPDA